MGVNVYLKFASVPRSMSDIRQFVRGLMRLLVLHVGTKNFDLRVRKDTEFRFYQLLFKHLSEIWITRSGVDQVTWSLSHEKWRYEARPIDAYAEELFRKINAKDQKYTPEFRDSILLFNVSPGWPSEPVLHKLQELCAVATFNFWQIWLASLANNGYCTRIHPAIRA
jgi:hypothetical protein